MKLIITFKDPDTAMDARNEAVKEQLRESNLPEGEQELLHEARYAKLKEFTDKWLEYDEYISVEFDTEAGTAVVLPSKN